MQDDFDTFMRTREAAAGAYTTGNARPLEAISQRSGPATFFDPGGGLTEGAENVLRVNIEGARAFGPNGKTHFDVRDHGASGDLAFWTGYQHASVELNGKQQDMKLRITEVFRRTDDGWKLVHRHASMAKSQNEKGR
ncbi:YybH family protein [Shinella sp. G-2]|uniref:YybH family protein n=1 Tax=Shinella sp. G-2 TaxID=3133141 RepID=UPI003D084A7C